jgi:hypothetical protein
VASIPRINVAIARAFMGILLFYGEFISLRVEARQQGKFS